MQKLKIIHLLIVTDCHDIPEQYIMDILRWIFLFAGVVASQACSPVPGWQPKSISQLVAAAPIVAKIKIVSTTGNINMQTAVAEVACSVKNEVGTPLGKTIVVTGFGSESLCRVPARTGEERLAFLQVQNSGSTPPTFRLVYTDMFAGTKPATPASVGAAKSAVRPGAVKTRDTIC